MAIAANGRWRGTKRIVTHLAVPVAVAWLITPSRGAAQNPRPGVDLPTDGSGAAVRSGNLVGVPFLKSAPQLGVGAGAVLGVQHQFDDKSPESGAGIGGFYTTTSSWMVGIGARALFQQDHWHVTAGFVGYDVRYDFFGIGTAAGNEGTSIPVRQSGNGAIAEALYRFGNGWYLGPLYQYELYRAHPVHTTGNPGLITFIDDNNRLVTSALGGSLAFDSRDDQSYPHKGQFVLAEMMFAGSAFGSDTNFNSFRLSANDFVPLSTSRVLAFRGTVCRVGVNAPFTDICLFGVQSDLRGYDAGRYRDNAMAAIQGEWRARLWGRFGVVAFAGVGEVSPEFTELSWGNLLPSGGVGLRYQVLKSKSTNIGVDYAQGKNQGSFYLRLGEAF